jgi:hypothetical protein
VTEKKEIGNTRSNTDFSIQMLFFYSTVFVLSFILFVVLVNNKHSDLYGHAMYAKELVHQKSLTVGIPELGKELDHTCPLWDYLVAWTVDLFGIPIIYAVPLVCSTLIVFSMVVERWIILFLLKDKVSVKMANIIVLQFTFVSALYVPWFNKNVYLGQGSINVWHNPTYIAVKPFALLAFFVFFASFYARENDTLTIFSYKFPKQNSLIGILSLILLCSVLAKPSFIQVFLPAVGIFLLIELIKSKRKLLTFCLKIAAAFIPTIIILFLQIGTIWSQRSIGGNQIGLSNFEVWSSYSPNIPFSILLLLCFPICVFLINGKTAYSNKPMLFSMIITIVGIIEFGFLKETGDRIWHGNFGWGYSLSALIFWYAAIIQFLDLYYERRQEVKQRILIKIGFVIFFLHFLCGVYYFSVLLQGAVY